MLGLEFGLLGFELFCYVQQGYELKQVVVVVIVVVWWFQCLEVVDEVCGQGLVYQQCCDCIVGYQVGGWFVVQWLVVQCVEVGIGLGGLCCEEVQQLVVQFGCGGVVFLLGLVNVLVYCGVEGVVVEVFVVFVYLWLFVEVGVVRG